MKFCSNCGNQINDTTKFCSNCGAPVADNNVSGNNAYGNQSFGNNNMTYNSAPNNFSTPYNQAYNQNYYTSSGSPAGQKKRTGKILAIAIPVVVICVIAFFALKLFVFSSGSISPESAVKNAMNAYRQSDTKKVIKQTIPNSLKKAIMSRENMTVSQLYDNLLSDDGVMRDYIKSYSIDSVRSCSSDERSTLDEVMSYYGIKVKKVVVVKVNYTYSSDYGEDDSSLEVIAYKCGMKWYAAFWL